ncbi:rhomboid family intramembrane serine protease [Rhabdobacter roseus]|uniref:Membrane associated rhomboid family serine protease n=1 Tax=Rhabdobacter roseus TaxID=1655419 RepID=A0A840TQ12_9BACT|nr:rhomboid family intramembrane serine protease [Rhabdobacter roseus]MBB5282140.1 membrane associated rhomboid family serine protease [Rhabdobacter roseus]
MSGIFDDFRREFDKSENALVKIILINTVIFLALLLAKVVLTLGESGNAYVWLVDLFRLPASPNEFIYKPWTIITYFFTHEEIFHILFNMLFLYWFGRLVDEYLGAKRMVALYILGGIAGGLIYMGIYNLLPHFQAEVGASRMLGASAAAFSVAVGASTLLPNYTFNLIFLGPIRIKYIAFFYIILSLAQSIGPNAGGNLAHLGGALLGYVFIKLLQSGTDLGRPVYAIMGGWSNLFRRRPTMRVTYREKQVHRSATLYSSAAPSASVEIPDQDEIDAILDKISKSGYESLTKEEKQKLFRASQQK